MKGWLGCYGVAMLATSVLLAACSPDHQPGKPSAGVGGAGENEAGGGGTTTLGGSPDVGGTSAAEAGAENSTGDAGSGSALGIRERFARASCHAYTVCAEARKDFLVDLLGGEAGCQPFLEHGLDQAPDMRERLRLVESGAVDADEPALANCLELVTNSCAFASALEHEACRRAIPGPRGAGESCQSSAECEPDTYCQADDASASAACAGKCAARKPVETECDSSVECASAGGYYRCEKPGGSRTGVCRAVTVQSDLAVGVACGTGVATEGVCRADLWCNESDSRCAEPIAPDEPCIDDYDVCAGGHFCTGTEGAKTCQLVTLETEENASCNVETLQLCDLTLGLECRDGACKYVGDGGAGTLCGVDSLNCGVGLYCDRDLDTCQPRLTASSPCTTDTQCDSGTCDATKHCAADYCALGL